MSPKLVLRWTCCLTLPSLLAVPAVAFAEAPVPRNPEMTLLVFVGSALLMLARLLRKMTEQRKPRVRRAAQKAA